MLITLMNHNWALIMKESDDQIIIEEIIISINLEMLRAVMKISPEQIKSDYRQSD